MKIANLKPNPHLRKFISRYWSWEDEAKFPKLLPGTGSELMFHYEAPLQAADRTGQAVFLPACHVITTRQEYYTLQSQKKAAFFAVRFRAGALRHFCRESNVDLADCFVDVESLWGGKGREISRQVLEAAGLEARIALIERFLTEMLNRYQRPEPWLDAAVEKLLYGYHRVRCSEVSRELFISDRQFQRKFKDATGVSPKTFQCLARFESVVKRLLLNRQTEYLPVALDNGYYDQPHFLKDFKRHVGEYPAAFLQDKNFMAHFYNERLL